MSYVFTLDSVFKSLLPKTQNGLDKPVCFTHTIVLLIYVNETKYLLGNLPFKISWPRMTHLVPMLSPKCMMWVRGLESL